MKRSPLILISGSVQNEGPDIKDTYAALALNYPSAMLAGGGLPWFLPCLPEADYVSESVRRCDGIILTGGDDINPIFHRKGIPRSLANTIRPAAPGRDLFDLMLVDEAFRQAKPLLAICRGHQLLNVALGGTLIIDIPIEVKRGLNHRPLNGKNELVHEIGIEPRSGLARIVAATRMAVNSSHHQAVDRVAPLLQVVARSPDGIIEALEVKPRHTHAIPYMLSVQFHPERMVHSEPEHLAIFIDFTRACMASLARGGKTPRCKAL